MAMTARTTQRNYQQWMLSMNVWIAPTPHGLRSYGTEILVPLLTERNTSVYIKCGYSVTLAPPPHPSNNENIRNM